MVWGSEIALNIVFSRPQNWSQLKPYYQEILGTHRAIPAGPTPLARTLSEHLLPDPIWTRFWPDLDLKLPFSGPNQVQIRSRGRCSERVGDRGVGPAGMALWVPKKVLTLLLKHHYRRQGIFTCCFPHPRVVNKFLYRTVFDRVKLIETDYDWLKLIETDWNWLKLTENRSKWIESRRASGENPSPKIGLGDCGMEGGVKKHVSTVCTTKISDRTLIISAINQLIDYPNFDPSSIYYRKFLAYSAFAVLRMQRITDILFTDRGGLRNFWGSSLPTLARKKLIR